MDDTSGKEGEGDIQNDNINRPERAAQQQQAEPKQRDQEKLLRDLHTILLETYVVEGTLVCGHCGHEYPIKESVANFLLPSHLGTLPLLPSLLAWCASLDASLLSFSFDSELSSGVLGQEDQEDGTSHIEYTNQLNTLALI